MLYTLKQVGQSLEHQASILHNTLITRIRRICITLRDNNIIYHSDCLANTHVLVKDVQKLELICDQQCEQTLSSLNVGCKYDSRKVANFLVVLITTCMNHRTMGFLSLMHVVVKQYPYVKMHIPTVFGQKDLMKLDS